MGLNENVTYIMKEKRTLQEHSGTKFTKERVQKLFPMRSPNKNKTHKAQMQVLNKNKTPMLHLEARISLMEVHEATEKAASAFPSVLSVPSPGTLSVGPTHCYCLKRFFISSSRSSSILPRRSWSKMF